MRTRASASTLALLLASHLGTESVAEAASVPSLFPRAVVGDGFLSIPVNGVERSQEKTTKHRRATDSINVALDNQQNFYSIQVGLGTPPQIVSVLVDTGSSELWVNPECSTARTPALVRQCQSFGQYDPSKSTTPPTGPFGQELIRYGDVTDPSTLTSVDVTYFVDDVTLGNALVRNQTFGVVTDSKGQAQGILGLAPDVEAGFDGPQPYSLLLNTMAAQGVIHSRAYSLDLRHADSKVGAIIYGGLDRSKFTGPLTRRPLVLGSGGETRLAVAVDSIGLTQQGGGSSSFQLQGQDAGFLLDSGTTLSRVHAAAAAPIINALGARDNGQGIFYVECSVSKLQASVDFTFGNTTIRVPFSDFVVTSASAKDTDFCPLGLVVTQDQQILGDSVLRAGYFIFDWDNREVHLAQAADCGGQDIVVIGSGVDSVPAVQGTCNADGTTKTSSNSPPQAASTKAPQDNQQSAGARPEPSMIWMIAPTVLASTMGILLAQLAW